MHARLFSLLILANLPRFLNRRSCIKNDFHTDNFTGVTCDLSGFVELSFVGRFLDGSVVESLSRVIR